MSLVVNAPNWRSCTTNMAVSSTTTGVFGTTITSGSANVDGTAVSILSALTHDVEKLTIIVTLSGLTNTVTNGLLDILIDRAGGTTWETDPLIPDLLCGWTDNVSTTSGRFGLEYNFPIYVPLGAALGARWRCSTTTRPANIVLTALGGNTNPGSWWCGQKVTALGITAASSIGTVHAPGASGSFSTWTNLGSTLPMAAKAFVFGIGGGPDNSATGAFVMWEIGISSVRIGPPMFASMSVSEAIYRNVADIIWYSAVAGTQMMVRGANGGATPESNDVAIYAVH